MSASLPESTGSRRTPPSDPGPCHQVRIKLAQAIACIRGALHSLNELDRQTAGRGWACIAGTIKAARLSLYEASEYAELEADVDDAVFGVEFHLDEVIGLAEELDGDQAAAGEGGGV